MVQKLASEFFGLVSKNKMAAMAVLFKFLGTFAAPVYQRACNVHFPNLQDMSFQICYSLRIHLEHFAKICCSATFSVPARWYLLYRCTSIAK